jgi:hypothetical protein
MNEARTSGYVAECFWPGVAEADLCDLDERIVTATASLAVAGPAARYLGSILMRDDEVVLCLFEGSETEVRAAAEQAAIPFERILATAHSPWPPHPGPEQGGSPCIAHP